MTNAEFGTDKWNGGMTEKTASPGETVDEVASQLKEKVSQFERTAGQKLDEGRSSAAGALQKTAQSLRSGAQNSGDAIAKVANKTADKIESTANYVRDHDVGNMMKDLEHVVRRNPTPSLCAAVAVGFLLGSTLRGRN